MIDFNVKAVSAGNPALHQALIILIGALIYSNTLHAPFVFDDFPAIAQNPAIQDLGRYVMSMSLVDGRVVGKLTFALNYALHGADVAGYHLFNILVHLCNAILVYWLVVLTLRSPFFRNDQKAARISDGSRNAAAFCVGLLFVVHPVQTQAVTYIVQRFASLATMFYLLSFLLYAKWRLSLDRTEGPGSNRKLYFLYAGSVIAAALALRTKEISFTLPVMLAVYEAMFFTGSFRKRAIILIPFILLECAVLAAVITSFGSISAVAAHDPLSGKLMGIERLSRWEYLFTQFRVIVTYLRLLLLPLGQNLDYDYPVSRTFFQPAVMASFALLLSLLCLAVYLFRSSRSATGDRRFTFGPVSFGLFWFFVTLSIESSIIPIDDVIMEHRLYLPSVGFFLAVVAGGRQLAELPGERYRLIKRGAAAATGVAVISLSVAAYVRNNTWGDSIVLYEDVTKKSPFKTRTHIGLGEQYEKRGLFNKAVQEYSTALLLNPQNAVAHYLLGNLYYHHGYLDQALVHYQGVLAIDPNSPYSQEQIGIILYRQGRHAEALSAFQAAVRLQPDRPQSRSYLELLSRKKRSRN